MIAGNLRWMKSALLGRSRHRPKVLISSIRMSKNFFRANLIDSSNSESPSGGNRRAMRHEPARPDQLAHSAGACRCRGERVSAAARERAASATRPCHHNLRGIPHPSPTGMRRRQKTKPPPFQAKPPDDNPGAPPHPLRDNRALRSKRR